jgi:hypothetical protein
VARRSFDTATTCMALVTFWMCMMAFLRSRMSLRLGIGQMLSRTPQFDWRDGRYTSRFWTVKTQGREHLPGQRKGAD